MMRRLISAAVLAAFVVGLVPATTFAAEETQPAGKTPVVTRASIERAAARAAADKTQPAATRPFKSTEEIQAMGGGGGGHAMAIIWSLVGTAISLGTTYYILKEMKKQTDQAAKQ